MAKKSIMSQIPYNAVVGFIFLLVGGSTLTGTIYLAIGRTSTIVSNNFCRFESFYSYIRAFSVSLGLVLVISGIIMVGFSFVASNATRGRIYHGNQCLMGGKNTATLLTGLAYILHFLCLIMIIVLVAPTLFWLMISNVCSVEYGDQYTSEYFTVKRLPPNTYHPQMMPDIVKQYEFNLTHYGLYLRPWKSSPFHQCKETLNQREFAVFCRDIYYLGPFYACSLAGTVLCTIGLNFMVSSLATFYSKLKLTKELTKYRQYLNLEYK